MGKFFAKNWGFFFLLVFSLIPILPLFHAGFFSMHDDTQIARVFEMATSLKDGMIPVRWVQDLGYGYGYPIFTFYAPLAYYIGATFVLFGFSALLATKMMMGIGIILSGIFMYFFARSIWGEMGGTLAGILYLYAPYHALDIYVRGDVAEFWAYAFLPLAFLGLWKIYQTINEKNVIPAPASTQRGEQAGIHRSLIEARNDKKKIWKWTIIGSVGFACIILTHNLTALMVTPFIAAFIVFLILFSKKKLISLFSLLSSLILALGLSAFYWLPVPFELQYTNVLSQVSGGADFHKNFVCVGQLWNSPWGYGGSIPGCIDGISFALGKIYIFFLFISILLTPFLLRKDTQRGVLLIGSFCGVVISLFFLLQIAEPIWNVIHVMAFLQYPWRFLLVVFFFISFLSGAGLWLLQQSNFTKKHIISFSLLIFTTILLVVIQGKYFSPQIYYAVDSKFYTNKNALEWTTSQITNEYMPQGFDKPQSPQEVVLKRFIVVSTDGKVYSEVDTTERKIAKVVLLHDQKVQVNLAYFPGWHGFIDGKEVKIYTFSQGIFLSAPKGINTITLIYKDTPIEMLSNGVSLVSILIIILGIIIWKRNV